MKTRKPSSEELLRRLEGLSKPSEKYIPEDVEKICRVCRQEKNPTRFEIRNESDVCYECSTKASESRERWRYIISGTLAFAAAVYNAHDPLVCGPDSLPGCLLSTSALAAGAVFLAMYALWD